MHAGELWLMSLLIVLLLLLAILSVCHTQGRVTDHRVGITEHGIDSIMSGERLAIFADALQLRHQAELLAQFDGQQ